MDERASTRFIHAAFISCLVLQRFGLILGGSALFLSLPVFLGLIFWLVATGRAMFRPAITGMYGLFVFLGLVSTILAVAIPDPEGGISLTSLFGIIVTYFLFCVRPNSRFSTEKVLPIFIFYVKIACVLGVVQYVIQYAGLRFFSITNSVPFLSGLTVESLYAYDPIIAYGSEVRRSNGLLFLEPSIFSQIIVMAIVVDVFCRKYYWNIPLYGLGYVVSYSGTGFLSLMAAFIIYVFFSFRSLVQLLAFVLVGLIAIVILNFLLPDVFGAILGRANEFQYEGSSGYARYVAQGASWVGFSADWRVLLGRGPGGLERSVYWVPGSGNPALKLFADYGLAGLISFFAFFLGATYRKDAPLVSILVFTTYQLGGGNSLFAPFIVMWAMLCVWGVDVPKRRQRGYLVGT